MKAAPTDAQILAAIKADAREHAAYAGVLIASTAQFWKLSVFVLAADR